MDIRPGKAVMAGKTSSLAWTRASSIRAAAPQSPVIARAKNCARWRAPQSHRGDYIWPQDPVDAPTILGKDSGDLA